MPKTNFDYAFVSTAQCLPGKSKTDWYDANITGFVLECRSTGGRTYYLRYSDAGGRLRQHKIGRYEDVKFADAKKAAVRLRSEVVMAATPRAKKDLARSIPQYSELAAMHLADAKLHLRSYADTEMYVRRHILPKWGKVRLTDIDSRAVAQWLGDKRAEGLAPATVEKIRVIFGRSFVLGSGWGVPGSDRNPTRGIPRKPLNNARERFLSAEEAARLRLAVAASQNTQLQHIVGLLLLTGARLRELLDARWEHVEVERKAWLIPTSKTGKPRQCPPVPAPPWRSWRPCPVTRAAPGWSRTPTPSSPSCPSSTAGKWRSARRGCLACGSTICATLRRRSWSTAASTCSLSARCWATPPTSQPQRYSHLANDTLLKAVEAGAAKQGR